MYLISGRPGSEFALLSHSRCRTLGDLLDFSGPVLSSVKCGQSVHLPGRMVVRVTGGFTEALCCLGRGGVGTSRYQGTQESLGRYGRSSACLDL